jgi:hypothetical protein
VVDLLLDQETFQNRLFKYSLAAGATLIAGALPANAGIIYTAVSGTINSNGSSLQYDLNGDTNADVRFDLIIGSTSMSLTARGLSGAGIRANAGLAVAFTAGQPISGLATDFFSAPQTLAGAAYVPSVSSIIGGNFANVGLRYVGVRFPIAAQPHFGWFRVNASSITSSSGTLDVTGMAYETCASEPINAGAESGGASCGAAGVPEPATLGMFATGAVGMLLLGLRRRRPGQQS